ncbi:hypothetical protein [Nocardia wallacei]|uniref:hypothetical protein n=1 Tax=Nocardia wallacei TaxID=480035 RepID=UPI0024578B0A|nr:hypothetical protein [Nocardia wallacei]
MSWWSKDSTSTTVEEIQARLAHEQQAVGWTHDAPAEPLTTDRAHRIMQQHLECLAADCPRKAAAFRALVDAGRTKPDSGRTY